MDHYKLLKVRRGATREEIKKAYKLLAFHFHPDRGKFDDDYFMMIHEAYETLMKEAEKQERRPHPPSKPKGPVKHDLSFVKGRIKKEQVWAPDFKHLRPPKITVESDQCPMCDGYGVIQNKYKVTMNCPRCRGTGHKTRIVI